MERSSGRKTNLHEPHVVGALIVLGAQSYGIGRVPGAELRDTAGEVDGGTVIGGDSLAEKNADRGWRGTARPGGVRGSSAGPGRR